MISVKYGWRGMTDDQRLGSVAMELKEWHQPNGLFETTKYLLIKTDSGVVVKLRADGAGELSSIIQDDVLRNDLIQILKPYVDMPKWRGP